MKKLREQKAITLISLVITVIVLLILLAISIKMIGGENGILKSTQEAAENFEIEAGRKKIQVILTNGLQFKISLGEEITTQEVIKILEGKDGIASATQGEEENQVIVITEEGYMYELTIDEEDKVAIEYIGKATEPIIR